MQIKYYSLTVYKILVLKAQEKSGKTKAKVFSGINLLLGILL